MAKKNYYAVIKGREVGVFRTWAECEKQTKGFKGSEFQGFKTEVEATEYFNSYEQVKEQTKEEMIKTVNEILSSLTEDQGIGARKVLSWFGNKVKNYFAFVGYAGTGKTYCINKITQAIIAEYGLKEEVVEYATFTGKAALVMTQKAKNEYIAKTLHRLLYKPEEDKHGNVTFVKKSYSELRHIRLLVVDEASMVSSELLKDMMQIMPGCKFLFVGDHGQLPPIGDRSWLYEAMKNHPDYELTKIHRQAEGSMIIKLATLIREGKELPMGIFDNVMIVTKDEFYEKYSNSLLTADQIICGTNKTRKSVNSWVRKKLGRTSELPQNGDKVVCRKNVWEEMIGGYSVVNGMMGTIKNYRKRNDLHSTLIFTPDFIDARKELTFATTTILEQPTDFKIFNSRKGEKPIHSIEYAYAITCHRSQGSQWNNVLIINEHFPSMPANKYGYNPEFLYTAVTRAVENVIIVIDRKPSLKRVASAGSPTINKNPYAKVI
jgi:exodeoxyribonuclease-5